MNQNQTTPQTNSKKIYDKPYECNHDSIVFFGKYKGQKHSVLNSDKAYCEWIMSTEASFGESTKAYIRKYIIAD